MIPLRHLFARYTWQLLSVVGGAALLSGAFMMISSASPLNTPTSHNTESAVYVGSDACFTCHVEAEDNWMAETQPRRIQAALANPHVVAVTSNEDTTRLIRFDREPHAVLPKNQFDPRAQQYVLQTEVGAITLPDHWRIGDQIIYQPAPNRLLTTDCGRCHGDNPVQVTQAWMAWAEGSRDRLFQPLNPERPDNLFPRRNTGQMPYGSMEE